MAVRVLVASYLEPPSFWNLSPEHRERLERDFPQVKWSHEPGWQSGFGEALESATVFFGWHLPRKQFERAGNLRWIHSPATGVRRLLYPELVDSEVTLTCSRGVHAPYMAELVMAWLLGHVKRLRRLDRAQQEHTWLQSDLLATDPPGTLIGKTLLLVGMGATGSELATRAEAFGMHVVGVRSSTGNVDAELPGADVVVNLLPHTDETRGFFSRERFEAMKVGVFFANVGRGATVDEDALAERLAGGQIAGAGLDVFATEPLPHESPFWKAHTVQISPHVAGVSHPELWEGLVTLFAENLTRFLNGETLVNVVDPKRGY